MLRLPVDLHAWRKKRRFELKFSHNYWVNEATLLERNVQARLTMTLSNAIEYLKETSWSRGTFFLYQSFTPELFPLSVWRKKHFGLWVQRTTNAGELETTKWTIRERMPKIYKNKRAWMWPQKRCTLCQRDGEEKLRRCGGISKTQYQGLVMETRYRGCRHGKGARYVD